jgi:hypothetical protein
MKKKIEDLLWVSLMGLSLGMLSLSLKAQTKGIEIERGFHLPVADCEIYSSSEIKRECRAIRNDLIFNQSYSDDYLLKNPIYDCHRTNVIDFKNRCIDVATKIVVKIKNENERVIDCTGERVKNKNQCSRILALYQPKVESQEEVSDEGIVSTQIVSATLTEEKKSSSDCVDCRSNLAQQQAQPLARPTSSDRFEIEAAVRGIESVYEKQVSQRILTRECFESYRRTERLYHEKVVVRQNDPGSAWKQIGLGVIGAITGNNLMRNNNDLTSFAGALLSIGSGVAIVDGLSDLAQDDVVYYRSRPVREREAISYYCSSVYTRIRN